MIRLKALWHLLFAKNFFLATDIDNKKLYRSHKKLNVNDLIRISNSAMGVAEVTIQQHLNEKELNQILNQK